MTILKCVYVRVCVCVCRTLISQSVPGFVDANIVAQSRMQLDTRRHVQAANAALQAGKPLPKPKDAPPRPANYGYLVDAEKGIRPQRMPTVSCPVEHDTHTHIHTHAQTHLAVHYPNAHTQSH